MGNLNTQYYLEAYDSYPYDLKQAAESLNYALAYDDEHAPTLCLMGKMQYEQLKDVASAAHYFEMALLYDKQFADTYFSYTDMLLNIRNFKKAKQIIDKAEEINAVCKACLWQKKSLWFEKQGLLKFAKTALLAGINTSVHNGEIANLNEDLSRVKEKLKRLKKQVEGKAISSETKKPQ